MNNWKEMYENEKRQRLHIETTMKEIVNGLCLSAFTISEDSKMQLLKNDLQRLQQEITHLEATKQQRLQQHLVSVGGMINQMTVRNSSHTMSNNTYNQSSGCVQSNFINNQKQQSAFSKVQRGGTKMVDANRMLVNTKINNISQFSNNLSLPAQQTVIEKFQKPRTQSRAPRRKRTSVTVEELTRSNSTVPPSNVSIVVEGKANLINRPLSAALPINDNHVFSKNPSNVEKTITEASESMSIETTDKLNQSLEQGNKSQMEYDIIMTETVNISSLNGTEKSIFYCDFCETESTNEEKTVIHLWKHVNEIKRMYAFECVIKDCDFKTNVMKDALTHKKTGHEPEANCKILDRRDNLNEYFKHCVNKYFSRMDDPTKEKIYDLRYC